MFIDGRHCIAERYSRYFPDEGRSLPSLTPRAIELRALRALRLCCAGARAISITENAIQFEEFLMQRDSVSRTPARSILLIETGVLDAHLFTHEFRKFVLCERGARVVQNSRALPRPLQRNTPALRSI